MTNKYKQGDYVIFTGYYDNPSINQLKDKIKLFYPYKINSVGNHNWAKGKGNGTEPAICIDEIYGGYLPESAALLYTSIVIEDGGYYTSTWKNGTIIAKITSAYTDFENNHFQHSGSFIHINGNTEGFYKKSFASHDLGTNRQCRTATQEEIDWLNACIAADKFVYSAVPSNRYAPVKFDSWYVKVTSENQKVVSEWRYNRTGTLIKVGYVAGIANDDGEKAHNLIPSTYFDYEISTEQFYQKTGTSPTSEYKVGGWVECTDNYKFCVKSKYYQIKDVNDEHSVYVWNEDQTNFTILNIHSYQIPECKWIGMEKPATAGSLLEEAKRRYPIGTKFYPPHITPSSATICEVFDYNELKESTYGICLYSSDSRNGKQKHTCSFNDDGKREIFPKDLGIYYTAGSDPILKTKSSVGKIEVELIPVKTI